MPESSTSAAKRRQALGVGLTLVALAVGTHLLYRVVRRDAIAFRTGERAFAQQDYSRAAAAYATARAAGYPAKELARKEPLALIRSGQSAAALDLLRAHLEVHPADSDLRALAVGLAQSLGQPKLGLALIAQSGPRETLPLPDLVRLADLHQQAGQLEEAIACAKLTLEREPANADLQTLLGQYLSFAGRRDEAIAAFNAALALNPAQRTARLALARNLAWAQRYAESVQAYRKYLGE